MLVLGIETSCDETGVALYHSERGLLAHALYTQAALHADYGGVVPELASRDHIRRVLPLTRGVLDQAACRLNEIDAVAYTEGPGLARAPLLRPRPSPRLTCSRRRAPPRVPPPEGLPPAPRI